MNEHLLKKLGYSLLTLLFWSSCFLIGFYFHDFFMVSLKQTALNTESTTRAVAAAQTSEDLAAYNTIESFAAKANSQNLGNTLVLYNNSNLCQKIDPKEVYAVKDPENLFTLINKNFYIKNQFVPSDLTKLADLGIPGRAGMYLRKDAANQLALLNKELEKLGLKYEVNSAWRSFSNQQSAINYWVKIVGKAKASDYAAGIGFSEHHLGTAVDLLPINDKSKKSDSQTLYNWLKHNAYQFGFVESYPEGKEGITGYNFEPWHYRYIGISAAEELHKRGITLTEYLYELNNYCMN